MMTPPELARQLGHTDGGRAIRAYLRKKYPGHPRGQRWFLDDEQVADVLRQFARK